MPTLVAITGPQRFECWAPRFVSHVNASMLDLASLDRYRTWSVFPARTALVMAALWGIPMTVFLLIGARDFGAVATIIIGTVAGLCFGFGWTAWMRFSIRRMVAKLHAGDGAMVPTPPTGATERLLCNFMLSERFAVGGHLYISDSGWSFVPHRRNLKRHQTVHRASASDISSITVRRMRKSALARLMQPDDVDIIELRHSTSSVWSLIAPDAEQLAERLRARLARAT